MLFDVTGNVRVTRSCISALLVVIAYLVFGHVLDFQVDQEGCQWASQLHWIAGALPQFE